MRLNRLPRDALDNVLSRLATVDVLALASASHCLSSALTPFLRDAHIQLDPRCKLHLLHPRSQVGRLIRSISIHAPLSVQEFRLLGNACPNLAIVSFHNVAKGVGSDHLQHFFRAAGPSLQTISAQFCAALSGPILLPTLATYCHSLTDLYLRFTPRVYAEHLEQLLRQVGHQLRNVELDTCVGVDDAVVSAIAEWCPRLKHLCVGGAEDIGDDGVIALAEAPCGKTLRHLDIRGCMHVTDVGVYAIATSCTSLTHINVWRVCVTSYAIRALAEGLGERLETLIMGDCIGIDDTALFSIADNCDALINLEMAGLRRVSDAGIMSLFDMKKTGLARLETLTIDGCDSVSDVGVLAAAGLWDGQWTRTIVDSEVASLPQYSWDPQSLESESEEQQTRRKEGVQCDHYDCDALSSCHYDDADNESYESESDFRSNANGANFEGDISISADLADSSSCTDGESSVWSEDVEDGWACFVDLECFEPAANVSYLRKLSATGMRRLGPRLFGHIHEARPDLELRMDVELEISTEDRGGDSCPESGCLPQDMRVGYPCGQYHGEGRWLEVRRRRREDSDEPGEVTYMTTATGIDTLARSYAKYRHAARLEQVGLS